MWSQVDRDELLEISGRDPYVRFATGSELIAVAGEPGWACVGPWRPGARHWGGAAVVSPGSGQEAESTALAALADLAADAGQTLEWFSTGDGRALSIPEGLCGNGSGRWAFLWTEFLTEPAGIGARQRSAPQDGGMQQPAARDGAGTREGTGLEVVELDDHLDAGRIDDFGRRHSTTFEGFPGQGFASVWLGLRDAGQELLAVGAIHDLASGIPHLAGIVVHADHRGRGLGRVMTAALTTRAIEEAGVSTLGVYSDNLAAVRLYQGLGYLTAHQFHTRSLFPAGQG